MDRFGEYLRAAREARGVSLGEISDSTHISVRFLEALENERFDLLPGGVFVISFTRQYARIVGLDEHEAVLRLNQVAHPVESALGEWTPREKNADDTGAKLAELIADFMRRRGMTLVGGIMTLVLVAGGLSYFQATESFPTVERAASIEPARSAQTAVSDDAPPAPPTQGARPVEVLSREEPNDDASEIAQGNRSIQLELKLTDRAWVRVVADGERVLEDNLEAGFEQTIRADDSVQLFIGNAGGVKVALNGESMPPIGPTGHVRRVDVSPTGMEVVDIEPKPGAEPTPPRPSEI
ncbi:MAG: RodZ domain-containing protein [Bryobacterales bacterium]